MTLVTGGKVYYYLTNLQGDVMSVESSDGISVASYCYDAWGKILSSSGDLAELNPLRYRGYVYDQETGFYYVESRYYDPAIGRFINADAAIGQIGVVQSSNMFAYCFNNPVNMSDSTGHWPKLSTIFAVVAAAATTVAVIAATVASCGTAVPALAAAGGSVVGGISAGAAANVATGAMAVAGVTATAAAVTSRTTSRTTKNNNSVYVLKDDTNTVQYVGCTNNVTRRQIAHSRNPARAGLEMQVIASGLSYSESRALEQAGMAYYHTINTSNKMNNQINSISPKYWGAFKELALGTLDYGWNQMTNEILYWTGN